MAKKLIPFSDESNDYYAAKYVAEASLFYEQKMLLLVDGDREKLRTSVPGVPLLNHLAYKLEPLYSKDGHRMYEFLIEYHTKKPSEGIYYGCRGVTLPGYDHNEEIEQLRKEWEQVKGEVCTILNNTFPSKDFSHRFRITDNANDQTYWLFWISLYEDEDIHGVGLRATEIIRSVFARFLNGDSVESYPMPSKRLQDDVAFTNESYQQLLDKIEYSGYASPTENHAHAESARAWFGEFLERACSQRFLIRSNLYEKAWQFLLPNADFSRMMVALFTCMDNYNITRKEGSFRVSKVPWESICKVFLSHDGMPLPINIKQQYKRDGVNKNQKSLDEWIEKIEEMMDLQKK